MPPLWWDEGWTLCVARNWVELGHYGCLLAGKPASPILAAHFPIVAPIALSFRLFGIGIWQGRIVGLLFTAGALILSYYLAAKLYNRSIAVGTLVILLLLPVSWNLHPLIMGRQVLGEMPMFFYLLAGYTCFFLAQRKSLLFMPLALGFWGIALMAKAQVQPFWAASLIVPLIVVLVKRQWWFAGWLVVGLLGSWGIFRLLNWGKQLLLNERTLPTEPLSGLIDVTILVPSVSVHLSTLQFVLIFCLPALLGLGYSLWQWVLHQRRGDPDNISDISRLMLLTWVGNWFAWFVFLSIGWDRYVFPALFIAAPFTAALLYDLTNGFNWLSTIKTAMSVLKERRLYEQAARAIGAIVLVILMCGLAVSAFRDMIRSKNNDSSVLQVIYFLNTATSSDSQIETWESELFFLLERSYHYPPAQVMVDLNHRIFLDQDISVAYDPLAADPDYLVIGPYGRRKLLYKPVIATGTFRLLQTIGSYQIYERLR